MSTTTKHLKSAIFFVLILPISLKATESSLYDIQLLSDYTRTSDIFKKTFNYPSTTGNAPEPFTTFRVGEKGHELTIYANENNKISRVKIKGNTPLEKLNFLGKLNLGSPANNLEEQVGLPAITQSKSDGSRISIFGNSNFLVETKLGKVTSISIYVTEANKIKTDNLKNYCSFRHPIWKHGDFFFTQVDISIKGAKKSVVALINSGAKKSTISHNLCRKLGCKASESQKAKIQLGQSGPIAKTEFVLIDSPKILARNFDVSLGTDFLFSHPLFLNLQQDYICTSDLPIAQIANATQMQKLSTHTVDNAVMIPIKLLNKKQTNVRIDSGNSDLALERQNIKFLQNQKVKLSFVKGSGTSLGMYRSNMRVLIGNIPITVDNFYVSPFSKYQKIGSKQMSDILWAFDLNKKSIYVKK